MSSIPILRSVTFVLGAFTLLCVSPQQLACAFSPYENYLLSGRDTHVGLIAQARPEKEAELGKALEELAGEEHADELKAAGITELSAYSKEIQDERWFVVYFTYEGGRDYLGAARAFESASDATRALGELIVPHPRAERQGTQWTQMEWINFIRGKVTDKKTTSKIMIVTKIKPEMEVRYRTLHQTVWPGVRDQIVRGNNRNLNIWLIEMGDDLVEFLYVEYVGDDAEADGAMDKSDPVNIRWWSNTDPCQEGLPGNENWVLMDGSTDFETEQ